MTKSDANNNEALKAENPGACVFAADVSSSTKEHSIDKTQKNSQSFHQKLRCLQ